MSDDHHYNLVGYKMWAERGFKILKDAGWIPGPATNSAGGGDSHYWRWPPVWICCRSGDSSGIAPGGVRLSPCWPCWRRRLAAIPEPHPFFRQDAAERRPFVFAHRGGGGLLPENTLPTFLDSFRRDPLTMSSSTSTAAATASW